MTTNETRKLTCPKCDASMKRVVHEGTEVDRCSQCGGIWFDESEVESLRAVVGAEGIDTGDARVGAALDDQQHVQCPVCAVKMDRVADPLGPHVWYERCPNCKGAFLDAGEFRDLKSDDPFELIGRLLDKP